MTPTEKSIKEIQDLITTYDGLEKARLAKGDTQMVMAYTNMKVGLLEALQIIHKNKLEKDNKALDLLKIVVMSPSFDEAKKHYGQSEAHWTRQVESFVRESEVDNG